MKWIGQHIVDFIARFRSDVYLEDISTGTIASGGNLGLDSNNKIVKAVEASGDITGVTITTDSGGGSTASDTGGSADFSILGATGVGVTNSGATITATAVPGEIDHDSLLNFASNEHYTQANITATGTIASGTWEGTKIADAFLSDNTAHLDTTQTFTGVKRINEREFTTVGGTDGDCKGDIVTFGTDASSHVAGDIYFLNSSSRWVITDADAAATSTGLLAVAMGSAASEGMCIRGMVSLKTTFPGSPANGDVLYLDNATDGAATGTAPTGNGDIVRVLGYKIGSGERMWFNPDNTFIEVTA